MEHTFAQPSTNPQPPTPRQEATTSQLMTRIGDLEKQLKETKQTFGKAILTLVDRVKTLEVALKRKTKRVLFSDSKEEETKAQGRKTHDLDPLVSLVQKIKSVDKGKRYKRRKSSKESAGIGLDFEEVKSAFEKVNTGSIRDSISSPDREEAGLVEAIRLDALEKALEKEEVAKQVHFDSLIAQRMAEEQELPEEQKKRKAQESVLGKDLTVEDYAKRMVELVNQRRKHFAEERARAKRNKPMTQTQLRNYMSNFLKNQGTWKLTQLKKLNFEEVKAEFEKLVKPLDTYVPINFEATKESLKRFGEELQTKTEKKLKFDDDGTQPTEEKIEEDKDDKPTKKTGKRRKQIARKGFHTDHDRDESEDSDEANEKDDSTSGTKIPINPVPVATKSPSIANYKIIKQGRKGVYHIIRENRTDMVYISFGAMLTDISRDDLTELYRIVMKKHGMNEPEDEFEKSADVYMLIERKYHLSAEVCKAMLDKKLQGGKLDEDCYKLLKMIDKQAGAKGLTSPEQTATGKGISNPFMAVMFKNNSKDNDHKILRKIKDEGTQRNLKITSEVQVRGGLRNKQEDLFTHKEEMDLEIAQTNTTAKLPLLKQGIKPDLDTMSFEYTTTTSKLLSKKLKELQAQAQAQAHVLRTWPLCHPLADLEQIHEYNLEEMDLKWQLPLLSMRARKFFQKTGRKITINESDTVGYDKLKVECFNSMLAINGDGFDWSFMADEEVPTDMALMAFSDSDVHNDKTCSKTCLKGFETIKTQLDDLRIEFNKSKFNLALIKEG
ncbi:hypothetical protein Tco_0214527 [Tanacetum coccineum]